MVLRIVLIRQLLLSVFSEEQESRILRIFKFWGLNERIGEYKKLVKERNNIAHSNGNIYYKEQDSVDVRISDVLRFAEEIHQKTKSSIEQAYKVFLIEIILLKIVPILL